jgi:hypothetical protein
LKSLQHLLLLLLLGPRKGQKGKNLDAGDEGWGGFVVVVMAAVVVVAMVVVDLLGGLGPGFLPLSQSPGRAATVAARVMVRS